MKVGVSTYGTDSTIRIWKVNSIDDTIQIVSNEVFRKKYPLI